MPQAMFISSLLKQWLLPGFVAVLVAVACSTDGGGAELTADTTPTATVVETIVADDTSATAELQVESTTTVPVSDAAQEHGPDSTLTMRLRKLIRRSPPHL